MYHENLLGFRPTPKPPFQHGAVGSAAVVLGCSVLLSAHNALQQEDTTLILDNGLTFILGGALLIAGILVLYGSTFSPTTATNATNATTTTSKKIAFAIVCLALAAVEICSFIVSFKLTKQPRYHFSPSDRLKSSELLIQGTLNNKMRYTILPNILESDVLRAGAPFKNADTTTTTPPPPSTIPGTFSIGMHVEVGSLDEKEKERGIAHFVEHLCFDASKKFNTRYGLWQQLDRLGINANAFTTSRSTVYEHFDVQNTTIDDVLIAAKEQLLYTIPTEKNINIEKGAVIGEWRMRNDTRSILDDREACAYFGPKSAVCQRFPIGLVSTISKFTTKDITNFLNKYYHPQRTHLFIAGDVAASDVITKLKKIFGEAVRGDAGTLVKTNAAGKMAPQEHQSIIENSAFGVYSTPQSTKNNTTVVGAYELILHTDVLNMDGIEFRFIASDPSHPSYYNTTRTMKDSLRNVFEILYSYVYAHMVEESISTRYSEIDTSTLLDFDISSGLNDDYDRNARYHTWSLTVSNGFSGEKGASNIVAKDNQWQNELEHALVELRRLSLYGPDAGLVNKAMDDYRLRNQKRTDTFTPSHRMRLLLNFMAIDHQTFNGDLLGKLNRRSIQWFTHQCQKLHLCHCRQKQPSNGRLSLVYWVRLLLLMQLLRKNISIPPQKQPYAHFFQLPMERTCRIHQRPNA